MLDVFTFEIWRCWRLLLFKQSVRMQKLDHFHHAVQYIAAPFRLNIYAAEENALFSFEVKEYKPQRLISLQ